jgi:hypothetical protein
MPPLIRRRPAPVSPDASKSHETLVAPLVGRTFELRRAYEQKLRILTDLQHEIDVVRSHQTPFPRRRQGFENLEHNFRELAKASKDASDLLKKIRAQFDQIHEEAHEMEKEQRKG